ncbi:hypothetical protein ACFFWD_13080 [Bradyrhizobium erythrophlei]
MFRKAFVAAVAAAALSSSTNAVLAQYKGPPIIVQTPQNTPPLNTDNLKPLVGVTLPATPAAPPAVAAPARVAPARPCATGAQC